MIEQARYRPYTAALLPPGVTLEPPRARFILRGDARAYAACHAVLGITPTDAACRAVCGKEWSALWLGPDEQLLLGPAEQSANTEAALSVALASHAHALVDVGHRQTGFMIAGSTALELLATGCPLDVEVMPIDTVTRTIFAKAEIVLWRKGEQQFHIEVWRSYADYLLGLLRDAAESSSNLIG